MQFCQFDWNDWISRNQSKSWCSRIQRGAQDPCFSKSWEDLISPTSEMKRIKKSSSWLILVGWLNSESARLSADLTDHVWFFQMCSKVLTEASYFYNYWLLYVFSCMDADIVTIFFLTTWEEGCVYHSFSVKHWPEKRRKKILEITCEKVASIVEETNRY